MISTPTVSRLNNQKLNRKSLLCDKNKRAILIPGISVINRSLNRYPTPIMWDGHVVTKSDRWFSSGHSGFLPHEDHPNANIGANEHD